MMPWLRSILVLLVASAALLATDWLLKRDTASGPGKRKWRLALLQFVQAPEVEDSETGFLAGLKDAGLVAGTDYEIVVRNANGDMSTMPALVDAALGDGADMLVSFSTPMLQTTMKKTERIPIVFTFVADPVAAGAGRDYVHHRANITGVYTHHACAEIIDCVRKCIPGARSVGTLFVPAEVNSVFNRDMLAAAAAKQHIEIVALPLATASDVPDAAAALCSRNIDAVVIAGGNLALTSFPAIAAAARRARKPLFGTVSSQFRSGAAVTVSRDYSDAGRQSAALAVRVMRGENPASIPFQPTTKTRLLVNLQAAQQCGLKVPASLLAKADEVKK